MPLLDQLLLGIASIFAISFLELVCDPLVV